MCNIVLVCLTVAVNQVLKVTIARLFNEWKTSPYSAETLVRWGGLTVPVLDDHGSLEIIYKIPRDRGARSPFRAAHVWFKWVCELLGNQRNVVCEDRILNECSEGSLGLGKILRRSVVSLKIVLAANQVDHRASVLSLVKEHGAVEGVALDGLEAGVADDAAQLFFGGAVTGTGCLDDVLF